VFRATQVRHTVPLCPPAPLVCTMSDASEQAGIRVAVYGLSGLVDDYYCNSPESPTVWNIMKAIKQTFGIPKSYIHLLLGHGEPPACLTLASLAGDTRNINFTLLVSRRRCAACGRKSPGHACGRCMATWYCSDRCAEEVWESHHVHCRALRNFDWAGYYQEWLAENPLHY